MSRKAIIGFALLLTFYLLICVFFAGRPLKNDECRYRSYAVNLTNGFYASPDTKHLWNGPGYPIFVSLFILLKLPIVAAKYCNAFFLFGAIIFFYRILCFYMVSRKAFWCAMLLGIYPPLLPELPKLLTESISVFWVAGFSYFLVKAFRQRKTGDLVWTAFFGASLVLTKVIYAYVVTAGLGISLLLCCWKREYFRAVLSCSGCIVLCLPYLIYTYSLSGKFFYWANSSGTALYCMSRPFENEWGDWFSPQEILNNDKLSHHRAFLETLQDKDSVEKDHIYRREALKNIRRYPVNYAMNWVSNIGRMWFDYPFAYKYQRPHTLFYMFPNAILLSAVLFSLYPLLKSIRNLPSEILMLGIFAVLFILGSSLIYTCSRYLVTIVPILMVLVCYCGGALLDIRWHNNREN